VSYQGKIRIVVRFLRLLEFQAICIGIYQDRLPGNDLEKDADDLGIGTDGIDTGLPVNYPTEGIAVPDGFEGCKDGVLHPITKASVMPFRRFSEAPRW